MGTRKKTVAVDIAEAAETFTFEEYEHELGLRVEESSGLTGIKGRGLHRFYVASGVVLRRMKDLESQCARHVESHQARDRADATFGRAFSDLEKRVRTHDVTAAGVDILLRELGFRLVRAIVETVVPAKS